MNLEAFPGSAARPTCARILGILNVTPDSFSDAGERVSVERAVSHALAMEDAGASVIDIGGESSRPGAEAVSYDEERRRVLPVVERLQSRLSIPMSIDTTKSALFRDAHSAGARILNDISALGEGEPMFEVLRETRAPAILMHMQGNPRDMQNEPRYGDVISDVCGFLDERLSAAEAAGLPRDRFVIDPGVGFGKTFEHNVELVARASEFMTLGVPVLYGTSRKSFLGKILDRPDAKEREWGTAATTAYLSAMGVHFLRVHDVAATADVIKVTSTLHEALRGGVTS